MRRIALLSIVVVSASAVAAAPPAAAQVLPPVCAEIVSPAAAADAEPARAWLCVQADTGVVAQQTGACSTHSPTPDCWFTLTVGHSGSANASAQTCAGALGLPPLCSSIATGTIPLIPVDPETVCIGWSLEGHYPCPPTAD